TLIDGLEYVKWGVAAGLDPSDFVPRMSFFFDVHNDFFEEIAKFRAARRIWAREIERRYHPTNPRALQLRTHAQTAGVSLTAQQPYNNVVRVALQALAAVLGGTQSLHTNSLDETYALPTKEAVTLALRTQQVIAHESGVADTAVPTLELDPEVERKQVERLKDVRAKRDAGRWREAMDRLRVAAKARGELMPEFLECARANASVGEQVQVLKEVFGVYHDPGY